MTGKKKKEAAVENTREVKSLRPGSLAYVWRRISHDPGAMAGMIIIALIIILSILSPYIIKYDYSTMDLANKCAAPSWEHPFGCDEMGRDILVRVLYGARYTLSIGVLSTAMAIVIGVIIGAIAGYFGGIADTLLMRALDVIQAFPQMLMAMLLAAVFGTGLDKCILALGISGIAGYARMTRANILKIRNSEYIEASVSIKCSTPRIIWKHILPNSLSPLIVSAAMGIASSGLAASALSFIGLGIQAPKPEWGAMLSSARNYIRGNPHMVIFPGLFIMITVISFNLIGDALRDALDPKLKD
ncbi:MAG: ABC transporter permease [Clostridiales bacterium]|nr:ABC transporter permease [Clostridiales bacterium]